MLKPILTKHAKEQFVRRYKALFGVEPSDKELNRVLERAFPEKPRNKSTRWHLFKRQVTKGKCKTYITKDGWRLVVVPPQVVVTIERVKPEENMLAKS
ncbi:MAG: hypothetical protein ACPLSJ_07590 [Thermosulfidibacteraceae bacterium]